MDKRMELKYRKVFDILPDIAECASGKLILVGGTALALFHLNHRISIDIDFVPLFNKDTELKQMLKGCLSKKGYATKPGAYSNQFVVLFEDTGIKVEVFEPNKKIESYKEHKIGNSKILVASVDEILDMKLESYAERLAPRDLFDIVFIMKEKKAGFKIVEQAIRKSGLPENLDEIGDMALSRDDYLFFRKVVEDASKASN